jgi:hypothetical protein
MTKLNRKSLLKAAGLANGLVVTGDHAILFMMPLTIGNHDPWWKASSKEDEIYGKDYVVKRLEIPNRY